MCDSLKSRYYQHLIRKRLEINRLTRCRKSTKISTIILEKRFVKNGRINLMSAQKYWQTCTIFLERRSKIKYNIL